MVQVRSSSSLSSRKWWLPSSSSSSPAQQGHPVRMALWGLLAVAVLVIMHLSDDGGGRNYYNVPTLLMSPFSSSSRQKSFPHAGFCTSDCSVAGLHAVRDLSAPSSKGLAAEVLAGLDDDNQKKNGGGGAGAVWKTVTAMTTTKSNGQLEHGLHQPFQMLLNDPNKDKFLAGMINAGGIWQLELVVLIDQFVCRSKKTNDNNNADGGIFVDVGANAGWFTAVALACGAVHVVGFEPFRGNMGRILRTVGANDGWSDRSTLIMNTVSFDSSRTHMKSTNLDINASNMAVTGSECSDYYSSSSSSSLSSSLRQQRQQLQQSAAQERVEENLQYGVDYMESVSLDQVFFTLPHLRSMPRIHFMKIDVEMFEIHVLDGAMRLLCEKIVEAFIVEVEYLKDPTKLANQCDFDKMYTRLTELGYVPYHPDYHTDNKDKNKSLVDLPLVEWPADALFILSDPSVPPSQRLQILHNNDPATTANPCRDFV